MTTIQNFHNQNINSLKFPNQNVYSTIQNFLNQNVYSKKMPQTTCLLCKTVTCLLGLLVDQSSVARLDLYGEHLGGRHPAGLVPGSYSSDTQDEVSVIVLFSVLCIARFKSFCARCPFYFSRDIVPARCWPNSEEVFSKFGSRRPCLGITFSAPRGCSGGLWPGGHHAEPVLHLNLCVSVYHAVHQCHVGPVPSLIQGCEPQLLQSLSSLLSPEIIRTALFWTFSNKSLSFWHKGAQAWTENSRCGLMYCLCRPRYTSLSR